jgi:hypothetical protein
MFSNFLPVGLVFVDSTDVDLVIPLASKIPSERHYERVPQLPLQGGAEDFDEVQSYSQFCLKSKDDNRFRKHSIAQSIIRYYRRLPPNFDPANPSIITLGYYPMKIIAAEWMVYTLLMSAYVKFYEYSFRNPTKRSMEADIVDLQRWRRRGKQSLHKLALVEQSLQCIVPHPHDDASLDNTAYQKLRQDFRYLSTQVEYYSQSFESTLSVAASIVQLTDARRSIDEAINMRNLTYIALVFIPMTFASGLLSMQDDFLPGRKDFGTYLALAVPLVAVVLGFSLVTSAAFRNWWRMVKGEMVERTITPLLCNM